MILCLRYDYPKSHPWSLFFFFGGGGGGDFWLSELLGLHNKFFMMSRPI
jgi:hypothetical protein